MSFCFVFFPSELVGGGKVSDLFLNYLSCMKDLSDCFSELLSPVPFSGHVCCSQCCTAAASPGVVNSEKSYLMPLLPVWSRLASCSCAKLSTDSNQSNPSHVDSSHRQGRFGLKWMFFSRVFCMFTSGKPHVLAGSGRTWASWFCQVQGSKWAAVLSSYVSWNFYA